MKERIFFGFMLPAGLLFAFPELSLVRCRWPHRARIEEETDLIEAAFGRGYEE